jgi:hypothetical protein
MQAHTRTQCDNKVPELTLLQLWEAPTKVTVNTFPRRYDSWINNPLLGKTYNNM